MTDNTHENEAENLQETESKQSNLEQEYAASQEEIAKLKEQILLNLADSENLRKRSAKQAEDAGKFAVGNLTKDLIEVLENLYLTTNNITPDSLEENTPLATIYQGVEMTKKILLSTLEKYGVKRIYPEIGENFDHNLHQAVAQIPEPNFADNAIVSVMRAGYTLHDRLLTASMVVVAKNTQ